jgi:hypothetical protein
MGDVITERVVEQVNSDVTTGTRNANVSYNKHSDVNARSWQVWTMNKTLETSKASSLASTALPS